MREQKNVRWCPSCAFLSFGRRGSGRKKPYLKPVALRRGGTPDTSIASYWGGSVQWITPAEMGKGESPYVAETVRSITEEGLKKMLF